MYDELTINEQQKVMLNLLNGTSHLIHRGDEQAAKNKVVLYIMCVRKVMVGNYFNKVMKSWCQ